MKPNPDVVARRVEGELVLVNLETNRIYSLNSTGARLWELLGEGRSRAEIVASLAAEYGAADAEVAAEVDRLLASLAAEALVAEAG